MSGGVTSSLAERIAAPPNVFLRGARSLESYGADPIGSYVSGGNSAVFSAREDLDGILLWGRPDESDVAIIIRALEIRRSRRRPPDVSLIDLRHVDSMDHAAFEKLSSYLLSRSEQLRRVMRCQALLVRWGMMESSAAFCQAMSANPLVQVFTNPFAALAWVGVSDRVILDQIEHFYDRAPTNPNLLSVLRAHLNNKSVGNLNDIARQFSVSARTFQRRLREVGTTFQREATHARLALAKRLMRETHHSLKWIAHECGCASVQHFSAFFHRHEGMSPSRWRVGQGIDARTRPGAIL